MLECDPNADVRRAVLVSISITNRTLPSVLERTRDTKEAVRQATYELLADKVHMKALSIAQRVTLLERGLNDRSGIVKILILCLII
jgi:condensin complex subunit 3